MQAEQLSKMILNCQGLALETSETVEIQSATISLMQDRIDRLRVLVEAMYVLKGTAPRDVIEEENRLP